MSLNILSDHDTWVAAAYDTVPGVDGKPDTYRLKVQAEGYIVYGSLSVGMDVLDESTAEEWLTRLRAWEIIDGPMVRMWDEEVGDHVPHPVTMEDLRPFFGTRTNNFPKETAAKFKRRVADAVLERAARRW